jgi:hypothetical protein
MKKNIRVPMSFIQDLRGNGQMPLFYPMAISLVCHVVFLVAFVVTPSLRSERPPARSVINVSMVSIKNPTTEDTENTASVGKQGPLHQKAEAAKNQPRHRLLKKRPRSLKRQPPKPKTSLKKKTFKSTQVVKQAIQQLEEKVEAKTDTPPATDQPEPLKSALDRLKKEVSQARPTDRPHPEQSRPFSWKNGRKTRRIQ